MSSAKYPTHKSPIHVTDMHTGGEPLRIITQGYPPLPEGTILEKRAYVRDNLDHLRRMLMFEPRGHFDMYGALLVKPSLPDADLAVLFMHNEGYSTMCGHAVIALGRYAVDEGLVAKVEPFTTVRIECPCGLVVARVEVTDGRAGAVSFESVPAFLLADGVRVEVPGYGQITCDVAYGGAFYALADATQFDLVFGKDPIRAFQDAATALTAVVRQKVKLIHPDHEDLAFLYGSILTDGIETPTDPTTNVCVFADAQIDRSPTGSGVTARLAAMHAKGKIQAGQTKIFRSITGAEFSGSVVAKTTAGSHEAIVAGVEGQAYYSGNAQFWAETGDPLAGGFLVQ